MLADASLKPPWELAPQAAVLDDKCVYDITSGFRAAAAELSTAKLVKSDSFTLFESVTALEIMDPKMDSGYLAPGETLEDQFDVCREVLPEEIVGIMDQLLCCEMAWHEGYPMSQTIFTNHYIDKLLDTKAKNLAEARFDRDHDQTRSNESSMMEALRIYCIAVIMCCNFVNLKILASGHFYDEEDFSTYTYGRELLPDLVPAEFMKASAKLQDKLRRSTSVEAGPLVAILRRLEFRTVLLSAMVAEYESIGDSKAWTEAMALLSSLAKTHNHGRTVPSAFSPKIQRRLASTVPPRPMVELKFTDAVKKLQNMCNECIEAHRILDVLGEQPTTSAENLRILLLSFSSQTPEPLPYSRACLAGPILGCEDVTFQEFLATNLAETILPADPLLDPVNSTFEAPPNKDLSPDPRYQVASAIGQFTKIAILAAGGYVDLFKAILSNRCRVRRNFCHVVMGLEMIQTREAPELDQTLMRHAQMYSVPNPLAVWSRLEKLRAMETTIQLGFELEVYLEEELSGMYWYLSQLAQQRAELCLWIANHIGDRWNKLPSNSKPETRQEIGRVYNFLRFLSDHGHATTSLAGGLSHMFTLLRYLHIFPSRRAAVEYTEAEDQGRYELRMKPFLLVTDPRLPTFKEFFAASHPWGSYKDFHFSDEANKETVRQWLRDASAMIRAAKEPLVRFQQLDPKKCFAAGAEDFFRKNLRDMLQSCIMLNLAVSRLSEAIEKGNVDGFEVAVKIPGERHPWWIIPKIVEKPI